MFALWSLFSRIWAKYIQEDGSCHFPLWAYQCQKQVVVYELRNREAGWWPESQSHDLCSTGSCLHATRAPYSDTASGGSERVNQDLPRDANPQSHTWAPGCDETQNLNDTDSETFFRYQIFSRPIPRLFSVPKFFETDSETFFWYSFFSRPVPRLFSVPNFFRDRFRYFFRYQKKARPIPRLFSVPKNFRDRFQDFFQY